MRKFEKDQIVFIRDYPYGKSTNIYGKVVGFLADDYYNILLTNGLNEGTIRKYKSYKLISKKDRNGRIKKQETR